MLDENHYILCCEEGLIEVRDRQQLSITSGWFTCISQIDDYSFLVGIGPPDNDLSILDIRTKTITRTIHKFSSGVWRIMRVTSDMYIVKTWDQVALLHKLNDIHTILDATEEYLHVEVQGDILYIIAYDYNIKKLKVLKVKLN